MTTDADARMNGARSGTAFPGRVLVTGGAGFIGRRVVRSLLTAGADVTVADLRPFSDEAVGSVVGDLCDPDVADRAVRPGTDAIIHLAAVTSVLQSVDDPAGTHRVNVDATANLLELARRHGVRAFLFASTNAVVGNVGRAVISEQVPLRPLTPYGATKAAAEMLLSSYSACYGIQGAALRFSNVYGPGMQQKDSFIPRLMRAARDGRGIQVRGDGSMIRDVVHVDDVVAGIFLAWRSGHTGPLILGSGQSVTVNEMVTAARRVTGAPIPVEHVPVSPGEMPAVVLDLAAARGLGYRPMHDLESGLATVWPEFAAGRSDGQPAAVRTSPEQGREQAAAGSLDGAGGKDDRIITEPSEWRRQPTNEHGRVVPVRAVGAGEGPRPRPSGGGAPVEGGAR